jgi:hypothetical protein
MSSLDMNGVLVVAAIVAGVVGRYAWLGGSSVPRALNTFVQY